MKFNNILLRLCNAVYKQSAKEKLYLLYPEKSDLGITKNSRDMTFTTTAAKVYNSLLLSCIRPEVEKILRKNQSNHQRSTCKKSQVSKTIVCKFLYTQRKDGANTTCIWYSQRNCYRYNDTLQKYKSNDSVEEVDVATTRWQHRLLRHFRWSLARIYISIIYICNLPRLRTMKVNK